MSDIHEIKSTSPEQIVEALGLSPHPEGGWYRETYRSDESIPENGLAQRYKGGRNCSTAIYYLLSSDSPSKMHRVNSDEVFHFYFGEPVQLVEVDLNGAISQTVLGPNVLAGQRPQHVVRRGHWQGLRVLAAKHVSLLGATVAPGFSFDDFELAERSSFLAKHPKHSDLLAPYL